MGIPFTDSHPRSHRLAPGGSLFPMAVANSSDVIYNMIARKMKSPLTTAAIASKTESRTHVSLGLTLAGIVTAILCALALLHDTYSTGGEILPTFIESSSTAGISELFTSATALVSSAGDMVIQIIKFL